MIGEKIKTLRIEAGMTQSELAEKCDTIKQTIYKYESGKVENIPLERVFMLASALNTTPSDLLGPDAIVSEQKAMTVGELLKVLHIGSHKTPARFSDGSGGGDHFLLTLHLVGHGDLLKARVESIEIGGGNLFLRAAGQEKEV